MFEIIEETTARALIKVIGVGGGGGNAVQHMMTSKFEHVEFVCANTDAQALENGSVSNTLQLGGDFTKGLGAGADPAIGRQAALDDTDRITEMLKGTDMVFITAGMGGGTGTGAAPVVAQLAREMNVLTVAVVTRPFSFEGKKRGLVADKGLEELSQYVDSLIVIPNEKLLSELGADVTLSDAFSAANNVLLGAVQGIAELITCSGRINVDFADVRTVMSEKGMAMIGTGSGRGEDRAKDAARAAISSPLLEDIDLTGAKGVLVNITSSADLTIGEFQQFGECVAEFTSDNATVVIGNVVDPTLKEEVRVTVVATGIGAEKDEVFSTPSLVTDNKEAQLQLPDRQGVLGHRGTEVAEKNRQSGDDDYLDIPAFLRRQAD
ncbi:MAG: cell division protein FtsZ [Gammaproteobacteria bacterium]|jgi:cell division protein FtsZ|tara:strand:+ start:6155 stop:7291 length:1137 start_codon:yes stop_codon:yes gene_type:complete